MSEEFDKGFAQLAEERREREYVQRQIREAVNYRLQVLADRVRDEQQTYPVGCTAYMTYKEVLEWIEQEKLPSR